MSLALEISIPHEPYPKESRFLRSPATRRVMFTEESCSPEGPAPRRVLHHDESYSLADLAYSDFKRQKLPKAIDHS